MQTIELSVSPTYVAWGMWPCLRELVQNAKDADDCSKKMRILYNKDLQLLSIINADAKLDRSNLVLGASEKVGNKKMRGQYGEGMKIAFANLLRMGKTVSVSNDDEVWQPVIEYSDTFRTNVLKLNVSSQAKTGQLQVDVTGVTPDDWKELNRNVLFLDVVASKGIPVERGKVLTQPENANRLFSKGLFVCDLPEKYVFGYDLTDIGLDRDRQSASVYAVSLQVRMIWNEMAVKKILTPSFIFDLLTAFNGESKSMEDAYSLADGLVEVLAKEFEARHGPSAVPVCTDGDVMMMGNVGLKGILLSPGLTHILSKSVPKASMLLSKSLEVKKNYDIGSLPLDERKNLLWAVKLVQAVEQFDVQKLAVVDFAAKNIFGCFNTKTGQVSVSRAILLDRKELLATVVHEVAHKYGTDGAAEHRAAIERIFSSIVVGMHEKQKVSEGLVDRQSD